MHIFWYRNFRRRAQHIPITALRFCRGLRVCVADWSIESRMGALVESSERRASQVNSFRSDIDWLIMTDLILSEHMLTSSLRTSIPICLVMHSLVPGSFKTSLTRAVLHRLATAFPIRLLLGVRANFRILFLYSKFIYNTNIIANHNNTMEKLLTETFGEREIVVVGAVAVTISTVLLAGV